ncbi:MAG: potassium/proton antiporter [Solirubrobacteraceae bacterium]|nr:potassium/proton antiporter [Solirubrobacteraceae bacterium]
MHEGQTILVIGALLAVALAASLLAGRLRVPGLVTFLAIGMLVGSDALGWIDFGNYEMAKAVGVAGLALILFEGGLAIELRALREVAVPASLLALLGTVLTAAITGVIAWWLLDLSLLESLLLGSIVAGTDGAAVFAIMRGSTIRRRLAHTLEGEAGLNDPVAVLLTVALIELITEPETGAADIALLFLEELVIGAAIGIFVGMAGAWALRSVKLGSAGLYPVASLAIGSLAFGGADTLHGSGFLAVFLCGVAFTADEIPAQRTIETFHEGLAWVAQLGLFLTLGLLVYPSQLPEVALAGSLLAILTAVVARPLAVVMVLGRMDFSFAERIVLGWAGLRGAVPIVLATFPIIAGVPGAHEIFNIVFFAVTVSTVLQAATFEPLAKRLGVTTEHRAIPAPLMETGAVRRLGAEVVQYAVRPDDAIVGLHVRDLELPRDALLNLIVQNSAAVPPRGSTVIQARDELHILVRQEAFSDFQQLLGRWRRGPMQRPERRPVGVRKATIFYTGPWREVDGDPGRPPQVGGTMVIEQIRTRRDEPGAVVALEDGRFAYTGSVTAVGTARDLRRAAERRLGLAQSDAEQSWWREVIGALALGQ